MTPSDRSRREAVEMLDHEAFCDRRDAIASRIDELIEQRDAASSVVNDLRNLAADKVRELIASLDDFEKRSRTPNGGVATRETESAKA